MFRFYILVQLFIVVSCSENQHTNIVKPPKGERYYEVLNESYRKVGSGYEFVKSKKTLFNVKFARENNQTIFSWEFQTPNYIEDSSKIEGLAVESSFSKGYVVKYSLDNSYRLNEIVNWDEILEYTDSTQKSYYSQIFDTLSEDGKYEFDKLLKAFNSKENIGNRLSKEMTYFIKAYGLPVSIDSSLEYIVSLNGVDQVIEKVSSYNKQASVDYYFFSDTPVVYDLGKNENFLSVLNSSGISSLKYLVIDSCIIEMDKKTSWPSKVTYWRNITLDTTTIKEVVFITPFTL